MYFGIMFTVQNMRGWWITYQQDSSGAFRVMNVVRLNRDRNQFEDYKQDPLWMKLL